MMRRMPMRLRHTAILSACEEVSAYEEADFPPSGTPG